MKIIGIEYQIKSFHCLLIRAFWFSFLESSHKSSRNSNHIHFVDETEIIPWITFKIESVKRRQKAKKLKCLSISFLTRTQGRCLICFYVAMCGWSMMLECYSFQKDMGPQYVLSILHLSMVVERISIVTSLMHFIYNELLKIFRFHTVSFVCFHTISFIIFAFWIIIHTF